ncbi:related to Adenylyltransferase and sulfurtransferase uba4 [Ramularia collo-cygni]|uniref:Adenylyltransferase and sulfurtransferase uba4 n=1 Tax=Ramularia collo-cygni TaxID=112498 RepID=A0A2D3V244_9PEZI|nr:related to Adenylyltransferase and sulfurtransferase uba4 [Ramularia collo-cygni]CZT14293.1 related to Adenylyltransferase and sulfurtransferase uba4 [Ramularia collo-cygni]
MAFNTMEDQVMMLRKQIVATESQLQSLKSQLSEAETFMETARRHRAASEQLEQAFQGGMPAEWISETAAALSPSFFAGLEDSVAIRQDPGQRGFVNPAEPVADPRWPLSGEEYKRYGRQMIMSEIGLHGQLRLKNARVLIVGVGGLGCPAAAYLAGAGVGTLGLMDGDVVEVSNLHRQVAHGTSRDGLSKVESAYAYLSDLNPLVKYNRHSTHLSPSIALEVFSNYDLVLDCTDHPTSRYLISDACVLAGKTLVSASALRTEGQLIVLNNPPRPAGDKSGGPCYRCVFPRPPPPEAVLSCGEGGIIGPVVGVMGVLQALEAIKVLTTKPHPPPSELEILMEEEPLPPPKPTLLMFSAYSHPPFRSVRMRNRYATCSTCSATSTISASNLTDGSLDYAAFCGITHPVSLLPPERRVSAPQFARLPRDGSNVLIDVRDETQYAMCALRGSLNVPWTGNSESWVEKAYQAGALPAQEGSELYVVCRYGNDSQLAVKAIADLAHDGRGNIMAKDIEGGFRAWKQLVDREWPEY